jgi:hypothetical protein
MGNSRRLKGHKQMSMNRRSKGNKKPMSAETKEARRKMREMDRARTLADVEKKKAKK